MGIIWSIIVGFFAGLVARWITPGDHQPSGFVLTTVVGIVGSLVATVLGQQTGFMKLAMVRALSAPLWAR